MSIEKVVKAVAYLRKSGGFNLVVTPEVQGGYTVVGGFKDPGAYGFTVGFAANGDVLEEAQASCIVGLANLVKLTEDSKPAQPSKASQSTGYSKPANGAVSSYRTSGAVVSIKGLKDDAWQKAKQIVKDCGFKYDTDSKEWSGGNVDALPDWLKKRVKGAPVSSTSASEPEQESEGEVETPASNNGDFPF